MAKQIINLSKKEIPPTTKPKKALKRQNVLIIGSCRKQIGRELIFTFKNKKAMRKPAVLRPISASLRKGRSRVVKIIFYAVYIPEQEVHPVLSGVSFSCHRSFLTASTNNPP